MSKNNKKYFLKAIAVLLAFSIIQPQNVFSSVFLAPIGASETTSLIDDIIRGKTADDVLRDKEENEGRKVKKPWSLKKMVLEGVVIIAVFGVGIFTAYLVMHGTSRIEQEFTTTRFSDAVKYPLVAMRIENVIEGSEDKAVSSLAKIVKILKKESLSDDYKQYLGEVLRDISFRRPLYFNRDMAAAIEKHLDTHLNFSIALAGIINKNGDLAAHSTLDAVESCAGAHLTWSAKPLCAIAVNRPDLMRLSAIKILEKLLIYVDTDNTAPFISYELYAAEALIQTGRYNSEFRRVIEDDLNSIITAKEVSSDVENLINNILTEIKKDNSPGQKKLPKDKPNRRSIENNTASVSVLIAL